jgi:alpha-1,2-mannosyltransferase
LDDGGREPLVLSLGQFRPEKNHALQLESFSRSLDKEGVPSNARLILVGGVRNADDEALLTSLKMRAAALGVASRVDFVVGCSFEELRGYLRRASVGVHTMRDEHFGIGIVEMMAAGLVVIAHRSGGPKEDIIEEGTNGYLAEDESEYADIIATVLRSKPGGWADIRASARLSVDRFSNESFDGGFKTSMRSLLTSS